MSQTPDNQPYRPEQDWPETMWPLEADITDGLPNELRPTDDELAAMKYPWQFLTATRKLLRETLELEADDREDYVRQDPGARIADRNLTSITGPVWLGPNAVVQPMAVIQGPAYVDGIVGSHTLIRNESIMLDGSRAGAFTEVKGSYMAAGRRDLETGELRVLGGHTSHHNYLLDSVLSQGAVLDGAAVTNNMREGLDEITVRMLGDTSGERIGTGLTQFGTIVGEQAEVKAGAHVMPGKMLGRFALAEAGVQVYSHIPDEMRLSAPQPQEPNLRPRYESEEQFTDTILTGRI